MNNEVNLFQNASEVKRAQGGKVELVSFDGDSFC